MKHVLMAAAMALSVAAGVRAEEYDVKVGDKTYGVKDGEKTTVVTPKGEEVALVVSRKKVLEYRNADVSFSYPSDMKIEEEEEAGVRHVTIERTDSALVIVQVAPGIMSPAELSKSYIDGVRESADAMKARFDDKAAAECTREVGGNKRTGRKLTWSLGPLTNETEIYTFKKGKKTIGVIFQVDNEDRESAQAGFKVIADSLK